MSSELLLVLVWCGGLLAFGTFVLVGRLTDGYDRSFFGPVASLLLLLLAAAYAAGYPYVVDLAGKHAPSLGSPDMVLLLSAAPALVFAIPTAVVAPVRAIFVLITVYGALLGQHYLPPLFPTFQDALLNAGVRMLVALVVAVPVFLSLFGRAGWAWLIPFAFAVQLTGPLVVDYVMGQAGGAPATTPPAGTDTTPGAGTAPDAMTLHLRASLAVAAGLLPAVLAFLALRRRPF